VPCKNYNIRFKKKNLNPGAPVACVSREIFKPALAIKPG